MKRWIVAGVVGAGVVATISGCGTTAEEAAMTVAEQSGLTAAIHRRLQADPQIAACWVSATVRGDTAIVRGRVPNPGLRERVLATVRETPGVGQVDDQLFVR